MQQDLVAELRDLAEAREALAAIDARIARAASHFQRLLARIERIQSRTDALRVTVPHAVRAAVMCGSSPSGATRQNATARPDDGGFPGPPPVAGGPSEAGAPRKDDKFAPAPAGLGWLPGRLDQLRSFLDASLQATESYLGDTLQRTTDTVNELQNQHTAVRQQGRLLKTRQRVYERLTSRLTVTNERLDNASRAAEQEKMAAAELARTGILPAVALKVAFGEPQRLEQLPRRPDKRVVTGLLKLVQPPADGYALVFFTASGCAACKRLATDLARIRRLVGTTVPFEVHTVFIFSGPEPDAVERQEAEAYRAQLGGRLIADHFEGVSATLWSRLFAGSPVTPTTVMLYGRAGAMPLYATRADVAPAIAAVLRDHIWRCSSCGAAPSCHAGVPEQWRRLGW